MINPLDLAGPQFLAFYIALGVVVFLWIYFVQSAREGGPPPKLDTSDPYLIAYLRGGTHEAARVATVSLIDRGLLKEKDTWLTTSEFIASARRPIENAILEVFRQSADAQAILGAPSIERACDNYQRTLTRLGLLPDEETRAARHRRLAAALLILLGMAAAKIAVALSRGRTNIVFLVILAVISCIIAYRLIQRLRTRRGDAVLADLQKLFARLKDRASSLRAGGATSEVALLTAVFGLSALPEDRFPYARRLYPKAATVGSSCGASCGSSCGGGCGGGCGGCGG
jgi:uncharacterized protein (TIGR04222 family)